MHTILTAENSTCKLFVHFTIVIVGKEIDEFERDFQKTRENVLQMKAMIALRDKEKVKAKQILIKEDIKKTRDDLTENLKTLRAQLRGKRKKYTDVELQNKQERIQKLQENIDLLFEMFEFQNKEQQRKLIGDSNVGVQIDIES